MKAWLLPLAALLLLAGCEEELTVAGQCPELCPGGQAAVRDTIILAVEASDTAFFGYTGRSGVSSLLVSDGLEAGEARAWVRFPKRADSVTVNAIARSYKPDSVVFTLSLVARDTLTKDLRLILHRVPITWDTLSAFPEVDAALEPGAIIDSLAIPDSLRSGPVRLVITDSATMANLIPAADTGVLAVGFRVRGDRVTGVRLGSLSGTSGGMGFATYVKADSVADTTAAKQTLNLSAAANHFVRDNDVVSPDPDLLYVGGVPSYRSIIRFVLPAIIKDSSVRLVRATLELTPADPLVGLHSDAAALNAIGVSKDIGAKSSPATAAAASALLPSDGSTALFGLDMRLVVERWRSTAGLPSTLLLAMAPEGGSFALPVFRSTRAATGKPRLRITYMLPSLVERP